MKKVFLTILFVLFGTHVSANWVSKDFTPSTVDLINVELWDNASGGCWTNLNEIRTYSQDKLELVGHNISREKFEGLKNNTHYLFYVSVSAKRYKNIDCFGYIEIFIYKASKSSNIIGKHYVGQAGTSFLGYNNVNQRLLDFIGSFMKTIENPNY
tara:strand:- start:489 stop:953 length:465 start_codon:yes stop_codon:yes gene_type:complete